MAIDMKKLEDLIDWVNKVNKEFERCNGRIHGDAQAWHVVYHDKAITNDRAYDWSKVCQALHELDPSIATRSQMEDIKGVENYLNKNWSKPRCFDKGFGKDVHQPCFKGFMEIKDLINRVTDYKPPEKVKVQPDVQPEGFFGKLFEIVDANHK